MEQFAAELKAKGRSGSTLQAYQKGLMEFNQFLEGRSLSEAREEDIWGWIQKMGEQGVADQTMRQRFSALRSFYRFIGKPELVGLSLEKWSPSRVSTARPQSNLTPQQVTIVLQRIRSLYSEELGRRNRALLLIFAYTGLYTSEVLTLPYEQPGLDSNRLTLFEQDPIYIPAILSHELKEWMKWRINSGRRSPLMFVSRQGNALLRRNILAIFQKVSDETIIVSPRILQQTFRYWMLSYNSLHTVLRTPPQIKLDNRAEQIQTLYTRLPKVGET